MFLPLGLLVMIQFSSVVAQSYTSIVISLDLGGESSIPHLQTPTYIQLQQPSLARTRRDRRLQRLLVRVQAASAGCTRRLPGFRRSRGVEVLLLVFEASSRGPSLQPVWRSRAHGASAELCCRSVQGSNTDFQREVFLGFGLVEVIAGPVFGFGACSLTCAGGLPATFLHNTRPASVSSPRRSKLARTQTGPAPGQADEV